MKEERGDVRLRSVIENARPETMMTGTPFVSLTA